MMICDGTMNSFWNGFLGWKNARNSGRFRTLKRQRPQVPYFQFWWLKTERWRHDAKKRVLRTTSKASGPIFSVLMPECWKMKTRCQEKSASHHGLRESQSMAPQYGLWPAGRPDTAFRTSIRSSGFSQSLEAVRSTLHRLNFKNFCKSLF